MGIAYRPPLTKIKVVQVHALITSNTFRFKQKVLVSVACEIVAIITKYLKGGQLNLILAYRISDGCPPRPGMCVCLR